MQRRSINSKVEFTWWRRRKLIDVEIYLIAGGDCGKIEFRNGLIQFIVDRRKLGRWPSSANRFQPRCIQRINICTAEEDTLIDSIWIVRPCIWQCVCSHCLHDIKRQFYVIQNVKLRNHFFLGKRREEIFFHYKKIDENKMEDYILYIFYKRIIKLIKIKIEKLWD